MSIQQAGRLLFVARRDLALREGRRAVAGLARESSVERGGGAALISREAQVTNGYVGVPVSSATAVEGNARVFVSIPLATAAATAVGLAAGLKLGALRNVARSERPRYA